MNRRPSIQMVSFHQIQSTNNYTLPPKTPKTGQQTATQASPSKSYQTKMKEQKRAINKPISVEVKRVKKQRGEATGDLKEDKLQNPMIIQQMEMGGEADQQLSQQKRAKSLPVDGDITEKRVFRIHHRSLTKYTPAPAPIKCPLILQDPKKCKGSLGSSLKSPLKLLAIEGRPLIGKKDEEMEEVENASTNANAKPQHFSMRKLEGRQLRNIGNQCSRKTKVAQFSLSFKDKGTKQQINLLLNKARKVCRSHQLFKLPKEKQRILQQRLRERIKSDLDERKYSMNMMERNVRNGGVINTNIFNSRAGVVRGGERKATMPWRKKREQELDILRGRIGDNQRQRLVIR